MMRDGIYFSYRDARGNLRYLCLGEADDGDTRWCDVSFREYVRARTKDRRYYLHNHDRVQVQVTDRLAHVLTRQPIKITRQMIRDFCTALGLKEMNDEKLVKSTG